MRRLFFLALLILLARSAKAQQYIGNVTAADSSGVCTTSGACVVSQPLSGNAATAVVQVAGTFSGTLNFMVVQDGNLANMSAVKCFPPNSTTSVATVTSTGKWRCDVSGMSNIVVQGTPWTSGNAAVNISITSAISSSVITGGASGGSGTVTNVSGTANQVDVATGTTTPVISLDPAITFPGSIATGNFLADFSAGRMELPEAAAFVSNVDSTIGVDTNTLITHFWGPGSADALNVVTATTDTTTTHALFATSTAGLYLARAIAVGDCAACAPLASPTFTGTPAAPTAAAGTNTTQLATTAFVNTIFAAPPAIGNTTPAAGSFTTLTNTGAATNSVAGAASTPGLSITGTPFAGTGTTSTPQLYMNGGTAPTTWNTGGTYFGINAVTGFAANFIDFHVNGGGSVFSIQGGGIVRAANYQFNNQAQLLNSTAPTIASGFGTSPSIPNSNGTAAFTVNVGTGGAASSGVITMPAASHGWACFVAPNGTPQAAGVTYSAPTSASSITLTNYTLTTGATLAWTASFVLQVSCFGY